MPRKNRPPEHRVPQHRRGKARQQGLHKGKDAVGLREKVRDLEQSEWWRKDVA